MTNRIAAPTAKPGKSNKRGYVLLAGGAAVALALGAGIGTWQLHGHTGSRVVTLRSAPQESVTSAGASGSQLIVPADRGHGPALPGAGMPGQAAAVSGLSAFADVPMSASYTVYLVGTQAEVDGVRHGPPALNTVVVLAADDEGAAQARQTIARQDGLRSVVGLPPITVRDLRQPGSVSPQ